MTLVKQVGSKCLNLIKSQHLQFLLLIALMILAKNSFAEDPLAGPEGIVKDAYNGSIKTYLYVGEAIAAVITLTFTRNIKVLGSVGAVAIFFNVVAILAGI